MLALKNLPQTLSLPDLSAVAATSFKLVVFIDLIRSVGWGCGRAQAEVCDLLPPKQARPPLITSTPSMIPLYVFRGSLSGRFRVIVT